MNADPDRADRAADPAVDPAADRAADRAADPAADPVADRAADPEADRAADHTADRATDHKADPAADHEAVPPPARRRIGLFASVAALALVLDVVSKVLVVANLQALEVKRVLGGVFYLDVARNSGAAFSFGTGFTVVLTVIAIAVVIVIVRVASRLTSRGWAVALGLILGGALGNLGDRLFRAPGFGRGHVVDWISLFGPYGEHWPIFNLADSAIVGGAILAGLLALTGIDIDGRRPRRG